MADNYGEILNNLFAVIKSRRTADPATSYVARQFAAGSERIAQKVGEEAVETVIAGIALDRDALVSESADLLFHLMMFWEVNGITPLDVFEELRRREGISGLDSAKAGKKPLSN